MPRISTCCIHLGCGALSGLDAVLTPFLLESSSGGDVKAGCGCCVKVIKAYRSYQLSLARQHPNVHRLLALLKLSQKILGEKKMKKEKFYASLPFLGKDA